MKRRIVATLLSGVVALSLAGCASSSSSSSVKASSGEAASSVASTSSSGKKSSGKTITVMASQDWVEDSEQELGKEFEKKTGIHVDYEIVPADQYQDLLLTRLNSGEGPDIFGAQSGFAIDTTYNVKENAVDLSGESWESSYNEYDKEQTSVDGKNYGLTYYDTTTDYYMVYNKKLFETAGIKDTPTTFDEFEADCQKLLDAGVTPIYEPVADGWHQTMLWTENGQVFDKLDPGVIDKLNNNTATFADDKDMKKALDQLNDLAQKGYFGDNYMSDEFANAEGYLASGSYAMCMLKPGAISTIVKSDQNTKGYTEDDFGLMLMPLCDNQNLNVHPTGPSRFIYSKSKNIDEAKQYLSFLLEKENVQYLIDNAADVENLPVDVGQTPEYSDTTKTFLASFDDDHQGMVLQDVVLYFNEQWSDISTNIAAMFTGDMTSDEVLKAIDDGRTQLAQAAGDSNWK